MLRPGRLEPARYNPPPMPFSRLDAAAVARTLSQIAEQPEDVVDAFFERREEVEVAPEGDPGALRVWREGGGAGRRGRGRRPPAAFRGGGGAGEARPGLPPAGARPLPPR